MRGISEPLHSAFCLHCPAQLGGLAQASNPRGEIVALNHHLLLRLHEGVGNLLTAISRRNEDNQSATGNDQAQGAGG
jgi:hypothetical protein